MARSHNGPHEMTSHGSDTKQEGEYVVVYETDLCWCGAEIDRREANRWKGRA
jgi:hypothetical protein